MGTTVGAISVLGFFACIIWLLIRLIRRKPAKPAGTGMLVCVILFFVGMGIMMVNGEVETKKDDDPSKNQVEDVSSPDPVSPKNDGEASGEAPPVDDKSEEEDGQGELRENFEKNVGNGSALFYENVRNDVTGKWRLFVYHSAETIADHAVEYYNAYFNSDDEIHWAVNLGLETTSCIKFLSGSLYIDVYEYVDKEEHDAKELGGGMLLNSYTVDLSSNEIKDMSSVTSSSGEPVNMDDIEAAIISALPSDYQSSKWFFVNCDSASEGGSFTDMQIDQGSDSTDDALSIAAECFNIAKQETENAGLKFEKFSITVVNGGAPIGLFSSTDGKTFTSISGGKRTEITLP